MSTTQANPQSGNQANLQTIVPNLFQLSGFFAGQEIHITYTTTGIAGKPQFTYQDAFHPPINFTGDQIRRIETPDLGTIVSVTIRPSIDTGSTTLSLLIPRIHLHTPQEVDHITTDAIVTVHRIPLIPVAGQLDSYTPIRMRGTARMVLFAAANSPN
jgi:hypothetical protein